MFDSIVLTVLAISLASQLEFSIPSLWLEAYCDYCSTKMALVAKHSSKLKISPWKQEPLALPCIKEMKCVMSATWRNAANYHPHKTQRENCFWWQCCLEYVNWCIWDHRADYMTCPKFSSTFLLFPQYFNILSGTAFFVPPPSQIILWSQVFTNDIL